MSRRPSPSKSSAYLQVARRHELRLPHRAGPRALEPRQVDVATLDDPQGVEELVPEELAAAAVVGERGQGLHGGPHAGEAAEVRLEAPDGNEIAWLHAVGRADSFEHRAMRGGHALRLTHGGGCEAPAHVGIDGEHGLGLAPIALDHDGKRGEAIEGGSGHGLGDATPDGLFLELTEEGREGLGRNGRRGRRLLGTGRHAGAEQHTDEPRTQADAEPSGRTRDRHDEAVIVPRRHAATAALC